MALVDDLPGPFSQLRLEAVHHIHAVGISLRAADHDHIAAFRQIFLDAPGHQGPHHLIVHCDVQVCLLPLDEPVVGNDLYTFVPCILYLFLQRIAVGCYDDDGIHVLLCELANLLLLLLHIPVGRLHIHRCPHLPGSIHKHIPVSCPALQHKCIKSNTDADAIILFLPSICRDFLHCLLRSICAGRQKKHGRQYKCYRKPSFFHHTVPPPRYSVGVIPVHFLKMRLK